MIIVAGKLFINPTQRTNFLKLTRAAVDAARQTKGCIDFAVSADLIDNNRVNVFEMWKTQKELESFRNEGPGEDLSRMILKYEIKEYEI